MGPQAANPASRLGNPLHRLNWPNLQGIFSPQHGSRPASAKRKERWGDADPDGVLTGVPEEAPMGGAETLSGVPGIPPLAPPADAAPPWGVEAPSMSPVRYACGTIAGAGQCDCDVCTGHAPADGMEDEQEDW